MTRHRKIDNMMTEVVVAVHRHTPVKEIVRLLSDAHVDAVPVLDTDRHVLGVVSAADLLVKDATRDAPTRRTPWGRLAARRDRSKARATTAEGLMTSPAITIDPDATVVHAARLMRRHGIKRLPVVDAGGRLIGIVSRTDLIGVFLRTDEEIRTEIEQDVLLRQFGVVASPATVTVAVHDGVVRLSGELDRRSAVSAAESLTRAVDGVVDVRSDLTYNWDDTHLHIPDPAVADVTGRGSLRTH